MTFRELCKTAANGRIQGPQPIDRNMKTDQYGNTRWTWNVPDRGADKQTVTDWENQRKADLQRQNPNIDLEANKDRWHLETIWNNYDRESRIGSDTFKNDFQRVEWYDPRTWFKDRSNAQARIAQGPSEAARRDPVAMYMERGRTQGYGQGAKYRGVEAARDAAELSNWLPYFTPELGEYVAGNLGVEGNASDWQDTRDTRMQTQEYADMLRRNYGMSNEQIADAINRLGKVYYVDPNDPNMGQYAGLLNGAQDIGREIFSRGMFINMLAPGAAGALGKVPGLGRAGGFFAAHPKAALGTVIGAQAVVPNVPHMLNANGNSTLDLAMGIDPIRDDETNASYMGLDMQREYNASMFSDGDGKDPASYSQYVNWCQANFMKDPEVQAMIQNGASQDQLESMFADWVYNPNTSRQFVNIMAQHGTGSYNLISSPMFQNLSPQDKVAAFRTMLEKRIAYVGKVPTLVENALGRWLQNKPIGEKLGITGYSDPEILSYMLEHDKTGSIHDLVETFVTYSDPESVNMLFGSGVPGGSKMNPEKMNGMFNVLESGFYRRLKENPDQVVENLRGLMNLQNAQNLQGGDPDEVAKKAAASIRRGVLRGMTEKSTFTGSDGNTIDLDAIDRMTDKDLKALANEFMKIGASGEAMGSMPDDERALMNAVTGKIKGRLWEAFTSAPFANGPLIFSLLLNSWGMTGLANLAKNPMVFWGTAATLLAGGLIAASSVFDDDDEDDEEEEEEKKYRKALRRDPYR